MAKNIKLERARIHIHATYNNTIITVTDMNDNPIAWKSPGVVGYKGSRKGTPMPRRSRPSPLCAS